MSAHGTPKEAAIKGRTFAVIGDSDVNIDLGGYSAEVQTNANGTSRVLLTAKPGKAESLSLAIDHTRGDLEFLQSIVDAGELVDFSLSYVDDTVYYGRMIITGDLKGSAKEGKADIELSGGKLKKQ